MVNEDKLVQVIDSSLDTLVRVLKAETLAKEDLVLARLASSVLSTGARFEATKNSRLSMQIRVASMVLKDSKERKRYRAAASPELKLLKG